ncbi:aluminum resistance protein, putative [Candida dubliniensis CD36]|uniref:Magnesium transporter, putative n=1 Tax=Candida dubliniensis (strain CD36 / ATCC MYA-646 / CBS 7987 / NCPF 3949 / NRRL Y-17841) TaxID=573826 RepID=B9WDK5_CANDC|nr:aluminum resistance protein, putative [Candida dubliniensis CD36]CAX42761.1 aluminum resistance protein, putative [Candida dubliniensis CD36]
MSDSESYYQNSTTNQPILHSDEVLNDHRNQIINDCAISDGDDNDNDNDNDEVELEVEVEKQQQQQEQQQEINPENVKPLTHKSGSSIKKKSHIIKENKDKDKEKVKVKVPNPMGLSSYDDNIIGGSGGSGHYKNRNYNMSTLRKEFYLKDTNDDDDDDNNNNNNSTNNTNTTHLQIPTPIITNSNKSRRKSQLDNLPPLIKKKTIGRNNSNNFENDLVSPMTKMKTNDSEDITNPTTNPTTTGIKLGIGATTLGAGIAPGATGTGTATGIGTATATATGRRPSRSSIDSEADSHASRSSQETEEDVCFPMVGDHIRVNGIDFDEIDEFIREEREEALLQKQMIAKNISRIDEFQNLSNTTSGASRHPYHSNNNNNNNKKGNNNNYSGGGSGGSSIAALKYTPKNILKKTLSRFEITHENSSSSDEIYELKNHHFHHQKSPKYDDNDDDDDQLSLTSSSSSSSGQVKFGGARISDGINGGSLPDRFSLFHSESEETIHAPDIPSLVSSSSSSSSGQSISVRDLFRNGEETWWLDCTCPTDSEMKMLAKAFGIHPLTAEDIRMQETREKVELFKSYYFVCFHTFEADKESEDYLEPINVYIVVFHDGILTFHFSPINHPANVRRRVRQLRDYVDVSADWLCYALIDEITDGFAPVIHGIEYEADAIEDAVFTARDTDFSSMLQRIGESRRKVMTLMRLLSGKADVIKMFAKRCQEEANSGYYQRQYNNNNNNNHLHHQHQHQHQQTHHTLPTNIITSPITSTLNLNNLTTSTSTGGGALGVNFGPNPNPNPNLNPVGGNNNNNNNTNSPSPPQQPKDFPLGTGKSLLIPDARPRADIALYLGDIQDHIITMFQNLLAYEKIFSRSHSNYLAQLQVESFNSNNKITEMFSKITLIGTMLVPLNLVTGLFGMNVRVPGEGGNNLGWFFGIVGVLIFIIIGSFIFAQWWLKKLNNSIEGQKKINRPIFNHSSRRSIRSLGLRKHGNARGGNGNGNGNGGAGVGVGANKSIISFPNKYE